MRRCLVGLVLVIAATGADLLAQTGDPGSGVVYQLQFVNSLNASYRKRREPLPDTYEADRSNS